LLLTCGFGHGEVPSWENLFYTAQPPLSSRGKPKWKRFAQDK